MTHDTDRRTAWTGATGQGFRPGAESLETLLGVLPGLLVEVAGCRRERPADVGSGGRGRPGSRPPLRLDVVHLADGRLKPDWAGADPREHQVVDRHGPLAVLEAWCRVVCEESGDWAGMELEPTVENRCGLLAERLAWIDGQAWSAELEADVRRIVRQARHALGIRPVFHPRCREIGCGHRLEPMDRGSWYSCTGCGRQYTLDADLRALGELQEGTLPELARLVGVPLRTLQGWAERGWIRPAGGRGRRRRYSLIAVRSAAVAAQTRRTG